MYGRHIGHCMKKLSILVKWEDVEKGLKTTMWQDTVNLFHIDVDEAKRQVFLSVIAERFRHFKSKLVSGWITQKGSEQRKMPIRCPTTKRAVASQSATSKKAKYCMGQKSYEVSKAKWKQEGLCDEVVASFGKTGNASSSSVTVLGSNRVVDWYCSLHPRDSSGKRVIKNPELKKMAGAVTR